MRPTLMMTARKPTRLERSQHADTAAAAAAEKFQTHARTHANDAFYAPVHMLTIVARRCVRNYNRRTRTQSNT